MQYMYKKVIRGDHCHPRHLLPRLVIMQPFVSVPWTNKLSRKQSVGLLGNISRNWMIWSSVMKEGPARDGSSSSGMVSSILEILVFLQVKTENAAKN